ncbi:MAG: hypothetical protein ABI597_01720 [Gammaproteobacteria bacterium]
MLPKTRPFFTFYLPPREKRYHTVAAEFTQKIENESLSSKAVFLVSASLPSGPVKR